MGEAAVEVPSPAAPTAAKFGEDEEYATTETRGLGAASTPLNAGGITAAPVLEDDDDASIDGAIGMPGDDDAAAARSEEGGGKARGETRRG